MIKLSAVVLTRDKNKNISKAVNPLSFCNEVIVIENKEITDFSKVRNDALKKTKNDWVLFLDDDEELSDGLIEEIKNLDTKDYSGFLLKRKGTVEEKLLRLAKKYSGSWKRKIHETWNIKGEIGCLKYPIIHNDDRSIRNMVSKLNLYSSLHAEANKLEEKKSTLGKIILFPILKFFQTYFVKKAYKKGLEGFVFSMMQSFSSFLSWSKLYFLHT